MESLYPEPSLWDPRLRGFYPGLWPKKWLGPLMWHLWRSTQGPGSLPLSSHLPNLLLPFLTHHHLCPPTASSARKTLNCSLIDPRVYHGGRHSTGSIKYWVNSEPFPSCEHLLQFWGCNLKPVHLPIEVPLSYMEQNTLPQGDISVVPRNQDMCHLPGHFRLLMHWPKAKKRSNLLAGGTDPNYGVGEWR